MTGRCVALYLIDAKERPQFLSVGSLFVPTASLALHRAHLWADEPDALGWLESQTAEWRREFNRHDYRFCDFSFEIDLTTMHDGPVVRLEVPPPPPKHRAAPPRPSMFS